MEKDKIKHFLGGLLLTTLVFIWQPLVLTGFLAGIAKELCDKYCHTGHPEIADMAYTWAGSLIPALIYVLLK